MDLFNIDEILQKLPANGRRCCGGDISRLEVNSTKFIQGVFYDRHAAWMQAACRGSTSDRPASPSGGTGVSGLTRGLATLPKVDSGAFSGQIQGWKTPKRTPGSALLLCVAAVYCWEISLG